MWSKRFDLEKQFTFYASYHHDFRNKLIHFLCIWPILATATILLANTAPVIAQPAVFSQLPYHQYFILNWSALVVCVYVPWYIILDWCAGTLGAGLILGLYFGANVFVQHAETLIGMPAWQIAFPIHITCWIFQFIGHGVFEKRAPALLDSLDQAIITAPLFVLLEVLFPLGYRSDLYARVEKQVELNIKQFRMDQMKKSN